jgi:mycothiol synthase
MSQLFMIWPDRRRDDPPSWSLPDGYSLRAYRPGDDEGYALVMTLAGFAGWDVAHASQARQRCFTDGLLFAVHDATAAIVATAAAVRQAPERYPYLGELGWVAADPAHRGIGLGHAVCAAATTRLLEERLPAIFLLTDDHRLPAIRTYLRLGWLPRLHEPDMEGRWRRICRALGMELEQVGYARE